MAFPADLFELFHRGENCFVKGFQAQDFITAGFQFATAEPRLPVCGVVDRIFTHAGKDGHTYTIYAPMERSILSRILLLPFQKIPVVLGTFPHHSVVALRTALFLAGDSSFMGDGNVAPDTDTIAFRALVV